MIIGKMKILLDRIVEECVNRSIKVSVASRGGEVAYRVVGFSKSGSALLYIEDGYLICETRYSQKDHILSFKDLATVAIHWYENYKDREPFESPEDEWKPVFKEFFYKNRGRYSTTIEDLPF